MDVETSRADVLIIGGGGAGLRAAIEADEAGVSVALVNKGLISRSGLTPMAGSSFQAAFGHSDPRDGVQVHFDDTVQEGRFLGDENLIQALVREAMDRAEDLERYGVRFIKEKGRFIQVRHAGQTYPRINQIAGRGHQMTVALRNELSRRGGIQIFEDCPVFRILTSSDGRPAGAVGFRQREAHLHVFQCKAVILATGGYEELWEKTDTAPDSTGDGIALAFPLGAELVDLEMMLYYPIATLGSRVFPSMRHALAYETLLGEEYLGGKLLNNREEEFLPQGSLPARDLLTRLIVKEQLEGRATDRGGVYVNLSRSPLSPQDLENRIEALGARAQVNRLKYLGLDLAKDPVEVAPACHYGLGGIRINEYAETSIPGLFAAGEVSGNLHGANRISGNALAETQVFGRIAGQRASREAKGVKAFPAPRRKEEKDDIERLKKLFAKKNDPLRPAGLRKKIKKIMEEEVGLNRSDQSLREAIACLQAIEEEDLPRLQVARTGIFNCELQDAIEVGFMAQVARLVATAALLRTESRGHHFRSDFPEESEAWLRHTIIWKCGRQVACQSAPVIRLK